MKSKQYSDRLLKMKQWEEIVTLYLEPGETSDKDKKELGRSLQIKWKNLREAFMKECRRQKNIKSGAGAKKNNQYRFYNQLLLLKPYAGINKTENSLSAADDNSIGEGKESVGGPYKDSPKRKKSDHSEEMTRELIDTLKSSMSKKVNEEDPDRQFMLSLVPDFKKVPDRLKSIVKINMIKCISQAQDEMYNYKEPSNTEMSYANNQNQGYFTNSSSYSLNSSRYEVMQYNHQNDQGTSAAGITDNITEAIPATPTTVHSNITDESEILSLF
ncbi:hypothetical protein HW555_010558 [Spodoptera exigua]|uniref:BESS domain-containing protein n=1 Tax=Spodoptera exigua TaxID=7107 RepID=A0A835G8K7_SPOEX|nr:hypothetical protein HW555_010558 [Spodoptera exigua]